jgi:hypothetical protein
MSENKAQCYHDVAAIKKLGPWIMEAFYKFGSKSPDLLVATAHSNVIKEGMQDQLER